MGLSQPEQTIAAGMASRAAGGLKITFRYKGREQKEMNDLVTGLPPGELCLEITESVLMREPKVAADVLTALRELGVRLAIDDFGSGNSSLAHFRRLPVDVLKIDRSYVTGMLENEDDAAIVDSTVRLAHALGLEVIAEGVEDAACSHHLVEIGCELAQGFYFGGPMPADDVAEAVAR